jgi:hypothetical protein
MLDQGQESISEVNKNIAEPSFTIILQPQESGSGVVAKKYQDASCLEADQQTGLAAAQQDHEPGG